MFPITSTNFPRRGGGKIYLLNFFIKYNAKYFTVTYETKTGYSTKEKLLSSVLCVGFLMGNTFTGNLGSKTNFMGHTLSSNVFYGTQITSIHCILFHLQPYD